MGSFPTGDSENLSDVAPPMNDALGNLLPFFAAFATFALGFATLKSRLARRVPVRVRVSDRARPHDTH